MHILVTGGAGFIGSNFVRSALQPARRCVSTVTVLDAMTYAANPASLQGLDGAYVSADVSADVSAGQGERPRLRVVEGSVCDRDLVYDLVSEADLVVHFAAESHNDRSLTDPMAFVRTNVEGTVTVAQAAADRGVRLHHVSTDEVYGDLPLTPRGVDRFTPKTPYRPSSPYSASKAASDHFIRAYTRSMGLEATISNCSNNYGPRQHPEKFIPRQIITLLRGGRPRVYGGGHNVRDWIHVADHNEAVWAIVHKGTPGQTYLIGADGERSNLEIVAELNTIFGRDPDDCVHVTDRPGHDRRYAIDPSSVRALGWRPEHTDLAEGLAQTVQWYRDNESWWAQAFARSEEFYRRSERELDRPGH